MRTIQSKKCLFLLVPETHIMKRLSLLVLLWMPFHGISQPGTGDKIYSEYVSPSPTAASFGREVNFPVASHHGLPSIRIPMYDLQAGDIDFPIALSYHASGVKVDQHSGWVGMGWSLHSGGVITRSVRGLPDDMLLSQQVTPSSVSTQAQAFSGWYHNASLRQRLSGTLYPFEYAGQTDRAFFLEDLVRESSGFNKNPMRDAQPDVYMINLPGLSLQFVFGNDGLPHLLHSTRPIRIEEQFGVSAEGRNEFLSFRITDEYGHQYLFDQKEYTTTTRAIYVYNVATHSVADSLLLQRTYPTSWYLSQVTTARGEQITFSYDSYDVSYEQRISQRRGPCRSNGDCAFFFEENELFETDVPTHYVEDHQTKTCYLKSIETSREELRFEHSARQDLNGGRKLDRIIVHSKSSHEDVKQYRLSYRYFHSTDYQDSYKHRRLFLEAVQSWSGDGQSSFPAHRFQYDETPLPARHSYEQDFWGYYNHNGAASLIPRVYVYPDESNHNRYRNYPLGPGYTGPSFVLPGADRSVNPSTIQAGVLRKIQLPTGGYRAYEYEPNSYYDPDADATIQGGGLRIRSVLFSDGQQVLQKSYRYDDPARPGHTSGVQIQRPIHARESGYVFDPDIQSMSSVFTAASYFLPLFNSHFFVPKLIDMDSYVSQGSPSDPPLLFDAETQWTAYKYWDYFTDRFSESYLALGHLDGAVVSYTHVQIDHEGLGETHYQYHPPKNFREHATAVETSKSRGMLHHSGSVTAGCEDLLIWGRIRKTGANIHPFPPLSDGLQLPYGKLLQSDTYSESGELLKRDSYEYTAFTRGGSSPVRIEGFQHGKHKVLCNSDIHYASSIYYFNQEVNIPSAVARYRWYGDSECLLSRQRSTLYHSDTLGILSQETVSETFYENPSHRFPTRTLSYRSDGSVQETAIRYPQDFGSIDLSKADAPASGIEKLRQSHQLRYPLETLHWLDRGQGKELLGGQLLSYTEQPGGLILPERQYELRPAIPIPASAFSPASISNQESLQYHPSYECVLSYGAYDAQGRPGELTQAPDRRVSLLWDALETYPLAVFEHAAAGEVAYEGFEKNGNHSASFAGSKSQVVAPASALYLGGMQVSSAAGSGPWVLEYHEKTDNNFPGHSGQVLVEGYRELSNGSEQLLGTLVQRYSDDSQGQWQGHQLLLHTESFRQQHGLGSSDNLILKVRVNNSSNSHQLYLDELRLYPQDARARSFSYVPLQGLGSQVDERGRATHYAYDGLGRLSAIRDHEGHYLESYDYHYLLEAHADTFLAHGPQPQEKNAVHHTLARAPYTDLTSLAGSTPWQKDESIHYYDGLGRLSQEVLHASSPSRNDQVLHHAYDRFNREVKQYLPYSTSTGSSTGAFRNDAATEQAQYYQKQARVSHSQYPWSEQRYEASVLNRLEEAGAPGSTWQPGNGHSQQHSYSTNRGNEVRQWTVDLSSGTCTGNSFYAAGRLSRHSHRDANGLLSHSWKNHRGQVVLVQQEDGGSLLETHYAYDAFGRLAYVIPPQPYSEMQSTGIFTVGAPYQDRVYAYGYDGRGRLIEKKVPHQGVVSLVYDAADQLIATQDGEQAGRDEWRFIKYDAQGREVLSGLCTDARSRAGLQGDLDQGQLPHYEVPDPTNVSVRMGYSAQAFPTANYEIHHSRYYDRYDFPTAGSNLPASYYQAPGSPFDGHVLSSRAEGLLTGERLRVLGSNDWLEGRSFYDGKGQLIQRLEENPMGGTDRMDYLYDFSGQLLHSRRQHAVPGEATLSLQERFTYDHSGRLLRRYSQVNNEPEIILYEQQYNELGQLSEKKLHGIPPGAYSPAGAVPDFLQSVDYSYHIRGWLTHINNAELADDRYSSSLDDQGSQGTVTAIHWQGLNLFIREELDANEELYLALHITEESELVVDGALSREALEEGGSAQLMLLRQSPEQATLYNSLRSLQGRQYRVDLSSYELYSSHDTDLEVLFQSVWSASEQSLQARGYRYEEGIQHIAQALVNYMLGRGTTYFSAPHDALQSDLLDLQYEEQNGFQLYLRVSLPSQHESQAHYLWDRQAGNSFSCDQLLASTGQGPISLDFSQLGLHAGMSTLAAVQVLGAYVDSVLTDSLSRRIVKDYGYRYIEAQFGQVSFNDDADDLWGMELRYEQGTADPQYEGTISQVLWQSRSDEQPRRYRYYYDGLNRLDEARYSALDATSQSWTAEVDRYSLRNLSYDANGNILGLDRYGLINSNPQQPLFGLMDALSYQYQGDRLHQVTDAQGHWNNDFKDGYSGSQDYYYDANGRLLLDRNKGLAVEYNHLHLPQRITFGEGESISYSYDASGNKLKQVVDNYGQQSSTRYSGPFVYTDGQLAFILHEEGRIVPEGGGYRYEYQYRDHLGNVRLSFSDLNGDGSAQRSEILQEQNYYPFGLEHYGVGFTQLATHRYKYNNKELQASFGLQWYDYGLRYYDPQIARWHVPDPLATEREWLSPYNFVQNNPILRIDPDGALDTKYVDEDDNVLAETDDGNDETVIIKNENVSAFFDEIEGHSAAGGNMNDPAYNQGLIEDYGHLKKIDGEVGVIGGSGMLEWAGTGGIAGSVKSAVSGVKHAVKVYKMIKAAKAAKAAKKAEAAVKMAKGGAKLLSAAPATLTQKGLNHILARHAFSSTAKGAGKFAQGTTTEQLKNLINTATTKGAFRPNTFNRPGTIAEFNFGRTIGTSINGNAATNLRVVVSPNGSVITAFPF